MKNFVKYGILISAFSLLLAPASRAEIDYEKEFTETLHSTYESLQRVAGARRFRLKPMNDSLQIMAQAVLETAAGSPPQIISKQLKQARDIYSDNKFAYLLSALHEERQGNYEQANKDYEEFLIRSHEYTEFEKAFISPSKMEFLRRVTLGILTQRGIEVDLSRKIGREVRQIGFFVKLFIILALLFIVGSSALRFIRMRMRPLEVGYKRCPNCRNVMERLIIECPKCRRPVR